MSCDTGVDEDNQTSFIYYFISILLEDPNTNEITIKAEKHEDGGITSARLESYQVWSTAQSPDIKYRGYVEVRKQESNLLN